jgi:hypothetical protein
MRTKPDPQRIAFQVALAWRQEDKSLPLYSVVLRGARAVRHVRYRIHHQPYRLSDTRTFSKGYTI